MVFEKVRILQRPASSCYSGRKCVTNAWLTRKKKKNRERWNGVRWLLLNSTGVRWKNWTNGGERREVGGLQTRAEKCQPHCFSDRGLPVIWHIWSRELWPITASPHSESEVEERNRGNNTPSFAVYFLCSSYKLFFSTGMERKGEVCFHRCSKRFIRTGWGCTFVLWNANGFVLNTSALPLFASLIW